MSDQAQAESPPIAAAEEKDYVLSREMIADGLSQLGRTADGKKHVYLSLSLPDKGIRDISLLSKYPHLQMVDLEENHIESLAPLVNLPHIVFLNLAHNQVSAIDVAKELPPDVRDLNLSFNRIESVHGFGQLRFLNQLYLDDNHISILHELENLHHLKTLSLRNNSLANLEGLEKLKLKELFLSGNRINTVYQLTKLTRLEVLDLSSNLLVSVSGLESLTQLQILNVSSNKISSLPEICNLSQITLLRKIDLSSNPVQLAENYRNHVVTSLISLVTLDRIHVTAEEKVSALNSVNPPKLVTLADLGIDQQMA